VYVYVCVCVCVYVCVQSTELESGIRHKFASSYSSYQQHTLIIHANKVQKYKLDHNFGQQTMYEWVGKKLVNVTMTINYT